MKVSFSYFCSILLQAKRNNSFEANDGREAAKYNRPFVHPTVTFIWKRGQKRNCLPNSRQYLDYTIFILSRILLRPLQLSSFVLAAAALVALSASLVSATFDVKFIVAEDNQTPFFIGSEKLVGVSTAMSTATNNAAVSSLLDTALSKKYDNATIAAWRRLMGNNATLVASSGPALSGEIKCFVGANGEVVGLQYGSAVVCQKSSRVVNVKIGTNYVSNIKVICFVLFLRKTFSSLAFRKVLTLSLHLKLSSFLKLSPSIRSSSARTP